MATYESAATSKGRYVIVRVGLNGVQTVLNERYATRRAADERAAALNLMTRKK